MNDVNNIESVIKVYIKSIVQNPMLNMSDEADRQFRRFNGMKVDSVMVVPELKDIPPAKQVVICRIIKARTGYEVSSRRDNLEMYAKIGHSKEMVKEAPHLWKKIRWLLT